MEKDLISFDDAIRELEVDAGDLKRMVSEGGIRAYRDEGLVKFRRDDIQALKESMDAEPTISLEDEDEGVIKLPRGAAGVIDLHTEPSTEFTELTAADFHDEVEIVTPARDKKGKPGRPVDLEDTVTGHEGDTVTAGPDEEETFVLAEDEEEESSKTTVPLELIDEEEHAGAGTAVVGVSEIQTPDMLGMPRAAAGRKPLLTAVLMLSTAILLWGALLVVSLLSGTPMAPTQWFARLF